MRHELIWSWLELSPGKWPPDHYALLGLSPGEKDPELIERQVEERLMRVRPYQLLYPEEATQAMNRLALAFSCLTDPEAKKQYDATLLVTPSSPEEGLWETEKAAHQPFDPLAWLYGPWSQLGVEEAQRENEAGTFPKRRPAEAPAASPEPRAPGIGQEGAAVRLSTSERRSPDPKRALYRQKAQMQRLLWAWEQAGKYLSQRTRRWITPAEATDLAHLMTEIRQLLPAASPLMDQPGKPGHLVGTLARQTMIVETYRTLLLSQRTALAGDWQAGYQYLWAQRQELQEKLRALCKKNLPHQTIRTVRRLITHHPELVLLLAGLGALLLALWGQFTR